ncbi:MAG: hypothetical protein M3Y26_08790 [Actinomycetota bacterium]|nr:hypothetical protein [Actinomycetota bacterium]
MSDADAYLTAMAAQLRGLRDVATEVAREAAPAVEAVIRRSAAAGTSVEGAPWPPKRDGSRALPDAAKNITAASVGTTVIVTLTGPYVFHNSADGPDRRRILPEEGAPLAPALARVVEDASQRVIARRTAGMR